MPRTLIEPVDNLPFGSLEKSRRYDSDRYRGAVGLNWYSSDPTLQFLMRIYLSHEGLAWAEPHLERVGALMGGAQPPRAGGARPHPPPPPRPPARGATTPARGAAAPPRGPRGGAARPQPSPPPLPPGGAPPRRTTPGVGGGGGNTWRPRR